MKQQKNQLANYSSDVCAKAISNFTKKVEDNSNYNQQLSEFVLSLYKSTTTGNESFFIDKTPRYYYIIDEIIELFPNAKFIFLFRNPVQIYASVLTTWCQNRFSTLYRNRDDLYQAPKLLVGAYEKYQSKSIAVHYEDLVSDSENVSRKIFAYLGIEQVDGFTFDLTKNSFERGEMGDPTGQTKYKEISQQSIQTWRDSFVNPIRKWYLKKYIGHLGEKVATTHGYKVERLQADIDTLPSAGRYQMIRDVFDICYYRLVYKFKLNLLFSSKQRNKGFLD